LIVEDFYFFSLKLDDEEDLPIDLMEISYYYAMEGLS